MLKGLFLRGPPHRQAVDRFTDDDLVAAAVESDACGQIDEQIAILSVDLSQLQTTDDPRALDVAIDEMVLANHIPLIGLEIPDGQQFPIEVAIALEGMQGTTDCLNPRFLGHE